jgi:periplasmic protein TonB
MRFRNFTAPAPIVSFASMSTPAIALPPFRVSRKSRRRRHALNRIPLAWNEVPVAHSPAFAGPGPRKPRYWIAALAALVVVGAHLVGAWYMQRGSVAASVKPQKNTLALEIVRPPKPAPSKVEPPPPPRKTPPRAPPPIQTAAPAPSEAPVAAPVEAVATVEPAPAAPPAPEPEPVKAAFGGIGYKNNPAPDYPALAARQGWQGTVLLRVRVLASGAVAAIEVVRTSGKKLLDDAAIATVERWVFAPSTRGGAAIDGFATVPIEFKLDS